MRFLDLIPADAVHRLRRFLPRLCVALAALPTLAASGLPVDRMVKDFDTIVFFREYQEPNDQRIQKWVAPIRVYLDSRAGDAALYRRLTAAHLAELSALTRHPISLTADPKQANLFVVFDRAEALFRSTGKYAPGLRTKVAMLRDSLCFGQYFSNADDEIFEAVVGIPSDRATSLGKLPACIVEETTQVLGLPNDSDDMYPTIFNDKSVIDDLTEHDKTLIRLLYDPRLPPGLERREALRRVRRILQEQGT